MTLRRLVAGASFVLWSQTACSLTPATIGVDLAGSSDSTAGGTSTTNEGMSSTPQVDGTSGGEESTTAVDSSTGASADTTTTGDSLAPCSPIEQDCPLGEACYPQDDGFVCRVRVGVGLTGDSCSDHPECEMTYFCDADGTCEAYCFTDFDSCSFPAQSCEPWFPAAAPAGLELFGACRDPRPGPLECQPFSPRCPGAEVCVPNPSGITCEPDGVGQSGDPCDAGCAYPNYCVRDFCLTLCNVALDDCIGPPQFCLPYYAPAGGPASLLDVGYCISQ